MGTLAKGGMDIGGIGNDENGVLIVGSGGDAKGLALSKIKINKKIKGINLKFNNNLYKCHKKLQKTFKEPAFEYTKMAMTLTGAANLQ